MIFKKKTHSKHSNQDVLINPHRLGRNTVKPMQSKESTAAINGGTNRRIDDFNRPNGYHSSLPNLNTQITPEKIHKDSKQEIFTSVNESTDLSSLLNNSQTKSHDKKPKKKRSKLKIIKNIIIMIIVLVIILSIFLIATGKINPSKLIFN